MEQPGTGTGVGAFGDNFEGDLGQQGACISMIADRPPDGGPLGVAARTRPQHRWPRQSSTSSGALSTRRPDKRDSGSAVLLSARHRAARASSIFSTSTTPVYGFCRKEVTEPFGESFRASSSG